MLDTIRGAEKLISGSDFAFWDFCFVFSFVSSLNLVIQAHTGRKKCKVHLVLSFPSFLQSIRPRQFINWYHLELPMRN